MLFYHIVIEMVLIIAHKKEESEEFHLTAFHHTVKGKNICKLQPLKFITEKSTDLPQLFCKNP